MADLQQYLDALNPPQLEAVLENKAPLLVLAGAGSGKTRVIATKIAYSVKALGIQPWQILAVTFTNKAAQEMRDRVQEMLPDMPMSEANIRTFHAFGAWLLRRFGEKIGLNQNFTIYDDSDSLGLLASCFPDFKKKELDPYIRMISKAKDMGLTPNDDLNQFNMDSKFPKMFEAYEKKLHRVGNVDFADLISRSIELLEQFPDVRQWVHRRFRVILVDEYQDSNVAQFNLLRLLVGPGAFICVVGDDDQSIYRFRGAEVQNILSFPQVYEGTKTVKLEQNYRSTQSILSVANEVIKLNKGRHPKKLWTDNGKGTLPKLIYVEDDQAEARAVAQIIKRDGNFENTAILYRTNAQSVAFETYFSKEQIPCKVVGALRFYEREEVKDAMSLVCVAMNPKDEVNWRRIINKPPRGIGEGAQEKIVSFLGQTDGDVFAAMRMAIQQGVLVGKASAGTKEFLAMYEHALQMLDAGPTADFANYLVQQSGLFEMYRSSDELNKTSKTENLEAFVNAIAQYPDGRQGVAQFLEESSLDPTTLGADDPRKKPGVTLITMHNTKGLEFDRVFIVGLEEGLFPGRGCESDEDMEEERRIFYVSVTRARKQLYMTCASRRLIWGRVNYQMPSPFIDDIPPSLIEVQGHRPGSSFSSEGYGGFGSLGEKRARTSFSYGDTQPAGSHRSTRHNNLYVSKPTVTKGIGGPTVPLPAAAKPPVSDPSKHFELGQKVYSESYGTGEVIAVKVPNGKEVIDVLFENGRKATFFSQYASLEKIGND